MVAITTYDLIVAVVFLLLLYEWKQDMNDL